MNSLNFYLNDLVLPIEIKGINKNFSKLVLPLINEMDQINLISDGSATITFYSNLFYDFYKKENMYYDEKSDSFKSCIIEANNFLNLPLEIQQQIVEENKVNVNKLMLEFLSASKSDDFIGSKINLLVPSLNMITDMNNTTSTSLSNNDEDNTFFNPYNSINLNFIGLANSLNNDSKKLFYKTIGIVDFDENYYFQNFKNKNNIIFAGDLISDNFTLNREAKKIINIYNSKQNQPNLKIWFKGHPRQDLSFNQKLKNKIIELTNNSKIIDCLDFIEPKLPFEIILNEPWYKNNSVKFYLSFSTIVLFLNANGESNKIKKIMVTRDELINDIKPYFGDPNQSILFPENQLEIVE